MGLSNHDKPTYRLKLGALSLGRFFGADAAQYKVGGVRRRPVALAPLYFAATDSEPTGEDGHDAAFFGEIPDSWIGTFDIDDVQRSA